MTNGEKMLEVFKGSRAKLEAAHNLNETITSKKSEYFSSTKKLGENYSEEILKKLKDSKAKLLKANEFEKARDRILETYKFHNKDLSDLRREKSKYTDSCPSSPGYIKCIMNQAKNSETRKKKIEELNKKIKTATENRDAAKKSYDESTSKINEILKGFSSEFTRGETVAEMISQYETKIRQFQEMKKIQIANSEAAKKALDESSAKMNEILKGFSSEFTKGETVAEMISQYETKIRQFQEMQKIETANAEALKKVIDDSTVDMNSILEDFQVQLSLVSSIDELISRYDAEINKLQAQEHANSAENEVIQKDSYLVDQDGHRVEEDYTYSN